MMLDRTPRKRQFSQLRSGYKTDISLSQFSKKSSQLNYKQDPQTTTRKDHILTPTRKRQFKEHSTGIKTPRKQTKNTTYTKDLSPVKSLYQNDGYIQTASKSIQKLKPPEYCVDCVNHFLSDKKKNDEKMKDQKQKEYIDKCNQINNLNRSRLLQAESHKKNLQYKRLLEENLNLIEEKQQKIKRQHKETIQMQRNRNRQIQQAERLYKKSAQTQAYKQNKLKTQLKAQIQEERERKKKQQILEAAWRPPLFDPMIQIKQRQMHIQRNQNLKKDIMCQIQEKKRKDKIQKQRELRIDETNQKLMTAQLVRRSQIEIMKNREHQKQLQEQIRSNKIQRKLQKDKQDNEYRQIYRKLKQQTNQQTRINQQVQFQKEQRYFNDLREQINQNKVKKIKEREFQRAPAFCAIQEKTVEITQPCNGCHRNYPLRYLSTIQPA